MSDSPQIVNARELVIGGRGFGWSGMATSFDGTGEVHIAVGHGDTRESAIHAAVTAWHEDREDRERESAVAALAGEEPRRRRKR